jgi:hypothetical protein
MSAQNLDSKLQSQEIYLDSQYATVNATGGSNSDIYFFLNAPIVVTTDHDIVLRVDNFVCPISFFVVNSSNNILVVNATSFTISEGNYNALTITTELNTLLASIAITTSYNTVSNKLTFSRGSSFTFQSSSTCFKLLGFEEGVAHTSVANSLTSDYVVNLSGTSLIYIDIPSVTTKNIASKNNGGYTTIIKSIVADVPYGAILSYVNNTNSAVVLKEKYISYFQVRLLDDEYNTLDLNGQHFTLTLELFFYYNGQSPLVGDNLADAVRQQEEVKKSILGGK